MVVFQVLITGTEQAVVELEADYHVIDYPSVGYLSLLADPDSTPVATFAPGHWIGFVRKVEETPA